MHLPSEAMQVSPVPHAFVTTSSPLHETCVCASTQSEAPVSTTFSPLALATQRVASDWLHVTAAASGAEHVARHAALPDVTAQICGG